MSLQSPVCLIANPGNMCNFTYERTENTDLVTIKSGDWVGSSIADCYCLARSKIWNKVAYMPSALTTYIFAAQINAFCGSVSDNFKVYNVNIREEEMILMPYYGHNRSIRKEKTISNYIG